jgi:hypothetical protein
VAIGLKLLAEGFERPAARRVHVALPARQTGLSRVCRLRASRTGRDKSDSGADQDYGPDADSHSKRNETDCVARAVNSCMSHGSSPYLTAFEVYCCRIVAQVQDRHCCPAEQNSFSANQTKTKIRKRTKKPDLAGKITPCQTSISVRFDLCQRCIFPLNKKYFS